MKRQAKIRIQNNSIFLLVMRSLYQQTDEGLDITHKSDQNQEHKNLLLLIITKHQLQIQIHSSNKPNSFPYYHHSQPSTSNPPTIRMNTYLVRGPQIFIAVILLVLSITRFSWNHIGQNIINLTAVAIFCFGLDNLIMLYRTYVNKQSFEFEATFIIMFLLFLGILFEKFNRSPDYAEPFNAACYIIDILVVALNLLYLCGVIATLGCYMIRHIYRLMTQTLLTNVANLQRHQIDNIVRNKRRFDQILRQKPSVNQQCSICFMDFQRDKMCIMLPGCEHCFHVECIEEWLNQKGTCPNCRSNLRLNIV